ncbi:MAG: hypothetical protein LBI69_04905, partial [Puniceicoccales bacterium]|nr:hypothetical protein [Puniceicoccales bacterium]
KVKVSSETKKEGQPISSFNPNLTDPDAPTNSDNQNLPSQQQSYPPPGGFGSNNNPYSPQQQQFNPDNNPYSPPPPGYFNQHQQPQQFNPNYSPQQQQTPPLGYFDSPSGSNPPAYDQSQTNLNQNPQSYPHQQQFNPNPQNYPQTPSDPNNPPQSPGGFYPSNPQQPTQFNSPQQQPAYDQPLGSNNNPYPSQQPSNQPFINPNVPPAKQEEQQVKEQEVVLSDADPVLAESEAIRQSENEVMESTNENSIQEKLDELNNIERSRENVDKIYSLLKTIGPDALTKYLNQEYSADFTAALTVKMGEQVTIDLMENLSQAKQSEWISVLTPKVIYASFGGLELKDVEYHCKKMSIENLENVINCNNLTKTKHDWLEAARVILEEKKKEEANAHEEGS